MAESGTQDTDDMSMSQMLDKLLDMTRPVPNDRRQDEMCNYINIFLSAFGPEFCMVVGSTKEGTRLRSEQDEGDYDYILLGVFTVPLECLEYREDLPCFVHIKGSFMEDILKDQLINGTYLPTSLLRNVSTLVFPRLKGILDIVSRSDTSHGDHTPHLAVKSSIKPGFTLTNYSGWKNDDIVVKPNPRSASDNEILKQFKQRVTDSDALQGGSSEVVSSFAAIVDFVQNLKDKDTSQGLIYQQLGPLLSALGGGNVSGGTSVKRPTATEQNEFIGTSKDTESIGGKKQRVQTDEDDSITTDSKGTTESDAEKEQNELPSNVQREPSSKKEKSDKHVQATFTGKSSKDFIPALRLSGPPPFIEAWKQRDRFWPRPTVVEVISRSQFFVVAKPAVQDEKTEIDFCLSCNLAEITLAKEMPLSYKKCLLAIKAFQRSILEDFSEKLTTFHWKTAIYRMLELTDPQSSESENVLELLKSILYFMRDRLHEGRLDHYFFPSNLFAGLDTDACLDIVKKIEEIYHDPIWHLRSFFCIEKDRVNNPKEITLPVETITKVKEEVEENKDQSSVNMIVDALEGFAQPSSSATVATPKPGINSALLRIAGTALADEERRRREKAKEEHLPEEGPARASGETVMANLTDLLSTQGADRRSRREAKRN